MYDLLTGKIGIILYHRIHQLIVNTNQSKIFIFLIG